VLDRARRSIQQQVAEAGEEAEAEIGLVVKEQKGISRMLSQMLGEAMSRAIAYPNEDPFKQMLVIKVGSEIARNIQMLQNKAWGLDSKTKTSATAIYEVLQTMEDTAEKKSIRIEEKYDE
tara:strand:- start:3692 stop:4051 length:360 start_codon:yes stop_codon:yes gene_type:complete